MRFWVRVKSQVVGSETSIRLRRFADALQTVTSMIWDQWVGGLPGATLIQRRDWIEESVRLPGCRPSVILELEFCLIADQIMCLYSWRCGRNVQFATRRNDPIVSRRFGIHDPSFPMVQLCRKIKDTGKSLVTWDQAVFKGRRRQLEEVRLAMQTLLYKPHNDSDQSEKLQLSQRLNELSRLMRKKNKLKGLYDRQGVWQNTPQGIEEVFISYFHDLFVRQEPDLVAQNTVLQTIQPRVTSEMNQTLLAPYSMEEVKVALFQMHPSKAPGPDGMSPFFFQKYWDLVGVEVSNAVISFLTTKDMPHDLNFTNVVLIPKVKEVQYMTELRPIALCNVVYKIASKVLANRLKTFLPEIVSLEESAFVPDRLISDNTLVASELAHYMHKLKRGKEGFMALKLDISKAYDRLDWDFLQKIMLKLGFDQNWVDLIMHCLSTVRYSFMINGIAKGFVTPHRDLRQGDPISPYLFLLCAEGLSALIASSVEGGKWKGLQVCDGAPTISHLLFADDSMLYSQASSRDCQLIRNILNVYEVASGQQVNLQKSSVVFSGSVLPDSQRSLAEELRMQVVPKHDKYLGTSPSYAWRSIIDGRDILKHGVGRQIGDGQRTNIWFDPWLKDEDLRMFWSPDLNKVSDLFLSPGVWNVNLLQELFPRHIVSKILALPISSRGHHDRWIWSEDKKGKFTVKSAYHLARKRVLDHG
ncbi:hypothetical protein ACLB2K_012984 [Fragaria x ananassa]